MNSLAKHFAQTMSFSGNNGHQMGNGGGGSGAGMTHSMSSSSSSNHNNIVNMMLYGNDDSALSELGRDELNQLMNEAVV